VKRTIGIAVLGLVVSFGVSGCATEYVEIRPNCTPPAQPALPAISRGELWDALGDEQYRELERYINGLWGYADEQAALLGELCAR
jgi:hypothetical protein